MHSLHNNESFLPPMDPNGHTPVLQISAPACSSTTPLSSSCRRRRNWRAPASGATACPNIHYNSGKQSDPPVTHTDRSGTHLGGVTRQQLSATNTGASSPSCCRPSSSTFPRPPATEPGSLHTFPLAMTLKWYGLSNEGNMILNRLGLTDSSKQELHFAMQSTVQWYGGWAAACCPPVDHNAASVSSLYRKVASCEGAHHLYAIFIDNCNPTMYRKNVSVAKSLTGGQNQSISATSVLT